MSNTNDDFVPPEDTMKPVVLSNGQDLANDDIDRTLSQLINLSKDILHEPTCIICSSPYRQEIEEQWVKCDKKMQELKDFMKQKGISDMSNEIIENHMIFHLAGGIKEIQKIEYSDKIKRLNSVNLTTLDRIKLCLSALTERLMGINSIVPSGNYSPEDIERIKSSETTKLMASFERLLKLQASIMGEMKSQGEVIVLPKNQFVNFFNDILINAKNQDEKQIVKKILDGLGGLSKMIQ